jgi:hypothetical protein
MVTFHLSLYGQCHVTVTALELFSFRNAYSF